MTQQTKYPRVGVGMIVYNMHGKVLMGKRLSPYGYGTWNNPGGKVDFLEDPKAAAIRETFEETNLKVINVQCHGYFNDEEVYGGVTKRHWVTLMFSGLCENPEEFQNKEPDKHSAWGWFTPERWPDDMWQPMRCWWANKEEAWNLLDYINENYWDE